jgi:large subunit ribosomal protein L17
MRHQKKRKFGKNIDHRRKLLRTLASSLVLHERIETTYANARAVRPYLEKLITKAKEQTLHNRRLLISGLTRNAAAKAFEVLGPKYVSRPGGYIRLTKLNDPKAGLSRVVAELVE